MPKLPRKLSGQHFVNLQHALGRVNQTTGIMLGETRFKQRLEELVDMPGPLHDFHRDMLTLIAAVDDLLTAELV